MESDSILHLVWDERAKKALLVLVGHYTSWCKHPFHMIFSLNFYWYTDDTEKLTLFQVATPSEVEALQRRDISY